MDFIELLKVIFLGIVEGITEWLPVSSTGHLILVEEFIKLNVSEAFWEMFMVVIQLGAIMAVVVLYFKELWPFQNQKKAKGALERYVKTDKMIMWFKIVVSCIPSIVIGLPFNDFIEAHFNNYLVVSIMLIVYGIFFILIENYNKKRTASINSVVEMEDCIFNWSIPAFSSHSRNIPFRGNYHRRNSAWNFKNSCRRIYFLPCNSDHVWCKLIKTRKIWSEFHWNRSHNSDCRNFSFFCGFNSGN